MIGIDWGTTNLRAFLFGADGVVIDTRASPRGIASLARDEIEGVLAATIAPWLQHDSDIVLAGMIGSRTGWVETGYVSCPVDPRALAGALVEVETALGRCRIVPGVSSGTSDVMRGEETQLLGSGLGDGCIVLPGTHSKWATLAGGRIMSVRTAMTGELYALLSQHSLIGVLIDGSAAPSDDAFERGVALSLHDPALLMTLFSARASVLLGNLAAGDVRDYLSGLLIGAEVAAMAKGRDAVTIIGETALADRYLAALTLAGVDQIAIIDGADAAAKGLWAIGMAKR